MDTASESILGNIARCRNERSPLSILTSVLLNVDNGHTSSCEVKSPPDVAFKKKCDVGNDSGLGDIDLFKVNSPESETDDACDSTSPHPSKPLTTTNELPFTSPTYREEDTLSCESDASLDGDIFTKKDCHEEDPILSASKSLHEVTVSPLETCTRNCLSSSPSSSLSPEKVLSTRKSTRKCSTPRKSPPGTDPRFKGATVWLHTSFEHGQSKLQLSAFYSNVRVRPRQRRRNSQTMHSPDTMSGSDTEDVATSYTHDTSIIVKTCASCRTRRTPLWRDAEDGTPLCNACGIRYKKYRLRCSRCWHIPKKDIKTYPNCPCCGAALRFSFSRRSW